MGYTHTRKKLPDVAHHSVQKKSKYENVTCTDGTSFVLETKYEKWPGGINWHTVKTLIPKTPTTVWKDYRPKKKNYDMSEPDYDYNC
jgi:hypothetical protein